MRDQGTSASTAQRPYFIPGLMAVGEGVEAQPALTQPFILQSQMVCDGKVGVPQYVRGLCLTKADVTFRSNINGCS